MVIFKNIPPILSLRVFWLFALLGIFLCSSLAWAECPSCGNCPAPVISSSTIQVPFNGTQTLQVSGGAGEPYSWTIVLGEGTLSGNSGSSVIYTAPSANNYCLQNPSIIVKDACGRTAEISLAVSVPASSFDVAGRKYSKFRGRVLEICSCDYSYQGISCDGRLGSISYACSPKRTAGCYYPPPPGWDFYEYLDFVWAGLCSEAAAACYTDCVCVDGYIQDTRSGTQKAYGCCPAQLMNCLNITGWSADNSIINLSAGQGINFTGTLPPEGTTWRIVIDDWVYNGTGTSISASWKGTNAAGKHVPAGNYTARLEAEVSGEQCVRTIPITVAGSAEQNACSLEVE